MSEPRRKQRGLGVVGGVAARGGAFAVLWWGLTEGAVESWLVGVPTVIAATITSRRLGHAPAGRWSVTGVLQFVGFFAVESLRAGIDVARRAFTLDIRPRIVTYESSLEDASALALVCGAVSLLPGTLTAEVRAGVLHVHTLDGRLPVEEELRLLERRVAAMLSLRVPEEVA